MRETDVVEQPTTRLEQVPPHRRRTATVVTVAALLAGALAAGGALLAPDQASRLLLGAGSPARAAGATQELAAVPAPAASNALTPSGTGTAFGVVVGGGFPASEPARRAAVDALGVQPSLVQYFADATHPLDIGLLDAAAVDGTTPLLTLETYGWALADIAAGTYDAQIRRHAQKLAAFNSGAGGTVLVRLNHEMNGQWYPWSEGRVGNAPGAYAAAWRRVVDVVRATGTGRTQVRWIWSPNVLRGAYLDTLLSAYPGDDHVDYLGLTGYGASAYEQSPADTFDETLAVLRTSVSADKPLIVTESGAGPGKYRAAWTRALGGWLRAHPDIHAFLWFDTEPSTGASDDWRFSPYADVTAALGDSLREAGATP